MNNEYQKKPLLICRNCINNKYNEPWGFVTYRGFYNMFKIPSNMKCKECGSTLEKTKLDCGECDILNKISHDQDFLLAMINLKQQDPIEYQLKYNQFLMQIEHKNVSVDEKSNTPKCPTCNSTNISPIDIASRVLDSAVFGVYGTKRYKTFQCNHCGYEW